jgi:hypothetical protein
MKDRPASDTGIEDIGARALRSRWFLGLVSAAIVGVLLLASWPWPRNRFVLKAITQVLEISSSASSVQALGVTLPKNAEIQIFGAESHNLPPELAGLFAGASSVRLVASSATLQSISLPSGAKLTVRTTSDGSTNIGMLNDGSISLALSGTIERIEETGQRTIIANIVRATAWDITPAEEHNPARVVLPPGVSAIALYNQPISDFQFHLPRPVGGDPRTFQSEILKGELQLLDTGTRTEVQPRELILLEGGNRFLARLDIVDKTIAVDVSGEAERISVGPPRPGLPFRLDRDLTPSVLSYLIGQHELKLLWGVTLAVLAALWNARQWALKWGR